MDALLISVPLISYNRLRKPALQEDSTLRTLH